MSKLKKLIDRLCPNGVSFRRLDTIGVFENIGVDKKTVPGQQLVKLLNYVDVYKHRYIDNSIPKMTVSAPDRKLSTCDIKKWDIFVTPTSETKDDIGHSAVITEDLVNTVYSYHIMRFRLNCPNRITACYINYLFESPEIQKQIYRFASGLTRFGLSKYKFGEITIPFPPLEVQEEIVKILDRFADYAAELQAELQARKEQYEYYRNLLLTFNPSAYGCGTDGAQEIKNVTNWGGHSYKITWKTMGEIARIYSGSNKHKLSRGKFPVFGSTGIIAYCNKSIYSKQQILIARVGANAGFTHLTTFDEYDVSDNTLIVDLNEIYNLKFIFYSLVNWNPSRLAKGGGQPLVTANEIKKICIPIPPLELQEKIVAILDRFETLVNDLTQGLPAEIAAVKEQYEYYRNKLLTFKKIA